MFGLDKQGRLGAYDPKKYFNPVSLDDARSMNDGSVLGVLSEKLDKQIKKGNITQETKDELMRQNAEELYGTSSFDQEQFETLLNKLTGSKMKQQRQKSVEGRRDIFAGGLAGMMRNF